MAGPRLAQAKGDVFGNALGGYAPPWMDSDVIAGAAAAAAGWHGMLMPQPFFYGQDGYGACGGFYGGFGAGAEDDALDGRLGADAAGAGARHSQTYLRRRRRQKAAVAAGMARLTGGSPDSAGAGARVAAEGAEAGAADELNVVGLTREIEEGGEGCAASIESLRGCVLKRSFEAVGCRLVQAALQHASSVVAAGLVEELHGHVSDLVSSPHANYVLQKVIEVMPAALSAFVAVELKGKGAPVSRHRYGCRILCRLLEHAASSAATMDLVDEVLAQARDLTRHSFAHHVVSAILEHGLVAQQRQVIACLMEELISHAMNRNASYVIEKALSHARDDDREKMALALADAEEVVLMAKHQFGSYVIRALLSRPSDARQRVVARLVEAAAELQGVKFGERVLQDMQKLGLITLSKPT